MTELEKLTKIVEKQTELIEIMATRLGELQKIALPEVKETASIAYTESQKAVDLANKALYYVPNTAKQLEEAIYNKVSSSIGDNVSAAVELKMGEFKWQLAAAIRD